MSADKDDPPASAESEAKWKPLARASSRPPPALPSDADPRTHAAWCTWLAALAEDPEAAGAAAVAYESLDEQGRIAWLDALEHDAPLVDVPRVALYAPLFAVEHDDERRTRIAAAMTAAPAAATTGATRALRGVSVEGEVVCVVVSPLYLDFVELLVCRISSGKDAGVAFAHHEPLCRGRDFDAIAERIGVGRGTQLSNTDLGDVVEDIAHAVVADRRAGRASPSVLLNFLHLFAPESERAG